MAISLNPSTLLNGNGIDVASLVTASLAPQSGQVAGLQQQVSALQNQSSLLTGINGDLGSLSSAINALTDVLSPLSAMSAQSSQSTILTASAQAGATAGTHNIVVNSLATQGTIYTNAVGDANASMLPTGSQTADIVFQVGGSNGPTHDVSIAQGSNNSLNAVVSYINSQNWGVTATVLSDATGARLAIYSNSSGSAGALSVVTNTSTLTFNPPVGGTDAGFTVDNIPFSSDSNTVSGAIPGVTLNLLGAFPGIQVQVAVAPDATRAAQAVNSFVSAYNTLIGDLNAQFAVDPATHSQGPLGSDSALRSLQSSLLANATYSPGGGNYTNLDALGITMNDDGTLSVDASQLNSALSTDPSGVLNFFQNTAQSGFANNFSKALQSLTDPTQGVLNVDLTQNRAQQQSLNDSISNLQDQMATLQVQLHKQFSEVNALLESFPYQLQAVQLELGITSPNTSRTVTGAGG